MEKKKLNLKRESGGICKSFDSLNVLALAKG